MSFNCQKYSFQVFANHADALHNVIFAQQINTAKQLWPWIWLGKTNHKTSVWNA